MVESGVVDVSLAQASAAAEASHATPGGSSANGLRDAGEVGDEGVQRAPRDVVAAEEVALAGLAVLEEGDVPGPDVARVDDVAAAGEGAAGGVEQVAQHDGVARAEPVEGAPEHDGRQGQHDVEPGARGRRRGPRAPGATLLA